MFIQVYASLLIVHKILRMFKQLYTSLRKFLQSLRRFIQSLYQFIHVYASSCKVLSSLDEPHSAIQITLNTPFNNTNYQQLCFHFKIIKDVGT